MQSGSAALTSMSTSSQPGPGDVVVCIDAAGTCGQLQEGRAYPVLAVDFSLPPLVTIEGGSWALRRFRRLGAVVVRPEKEAL